MQQVIHGLGIAPIWKLYALCLTAVGIPLLPSIQRPRSPDLAAFGASCHFCPRNRGYNDRWISSSRRHRRQHPYRHWHHQLQVKELHKFATTLSSLDW